MQTSILNYAKENMTSAFGEYSMHIPIAQPSLGDEETSAVLAVLASGMIAQGPETAAFEEEFAAYCGVPHAVATNNGTAALHAALLAAGVGPGDEVIVPAFTFFATASAVSMCGAVPVFADVDPAEILANVSQKTKAVIAVHLYGQPCDAGAVREICDDEDLVFIEDAAQAHGAEYHGTRTRALGDLACFSFYAMKNMATGDCGMVTTRSDEYDERLERPCGCGPGPDRRRGRRVGRRNRPEPVRRWACRRADRRDHQRT